MALLKFLNEFQPDILFLQEIRANINQISFFLRNVVGYDSLFNDSGKAGYGGTGIYWKTKLNLNPCIEIGNDLLEQEGRCIKVQVEDLNMINVYVPNGNSSDERLDYKFRFLSELGAYMANTSKNNCKLVVGGDFNIAHKDIDTFAYKSAKLSGFLPGERKWMDDVLNLGFTDTFRIFNKEDGNYTWWHMKDRTRQKNKGWRYDYFLVSNNLKNKVKKAEIRREVFGSDHCPIYLKLTFR